MAGAPLGNQNAAKAKQWLAAIERAIERLADPSIDPDVPIARTPKMRGLDMMADNYVRLHSSEDPLAFYRDFGDRLDGKPAQQVALTGADDGPLVVKISAEDAKAL